MLNLTPFKYKFIPAEGAKPGGPILVLVHGRTGNLQILEWYSKRFEVPGLSYLTIEAPFPDQNPKSEQPGFSWYLKNQEGIDEARRGLIKMVEELDRQGFSPSQLFWLGFSQGAAMSLDLALRGPFKMGGFICISGLCVDFETYPKAFGPFAREQRILITHGTRDEIISLELAEKTYSVLRAEKIPFEFKVFDKPHSFHLKEEVPFLEKTLRGWTTSR